MFNYVTNWFSIVAGFVFVGAVIYGFFVASQDWRVLTMYGCFATINFIAGTL